MTTTSTSSGWQRTVTIMADNVIQLFSDKRGDPEDEDGPLHTQMYASPAGIFIQQENTDGDLENPDTIGLSWEQTAMLLTNLVALLHGKMNQEEGDDEDGTIH